MARAKDSRLAPTATVLLAGTLAAAPAHAYLDPGTGSIILQSLLAGVAVAIGVVRLYWHRFKSFISTLTGNPNSEPHKEEREITQEADIHNES